ncbi:MAG: hypothetical protein PSX36_10560, partial [bacterium]|nr:hypothetical protein [bacterium]
RILLCAATSSYCKYSPTPVEKLPLKKYKTILEKGGLNYTDDEVLSTIELLLLIAGMDYEIYSNRQKKELEFKKLKELEKSETL